MSAEPGRLAVEYLLAARTGSDEAGAPGRELARLEPSELGIALGDDGARLAFWIDVYNATVLCARPPDLLHLSGRRRFFGRPAVTVAGETLTFDDIEHGLLRRSRWKLGLGYVPNLRPSPFERRQRLRRVDARIHFALNCAAASCPPISAYRAADIDEQLDLATRSYLRSTVVSDATSTEVPALFLWFMGDFGGPPGVRRFLRDHGVAGWGRRLRFATWDWTPTRGRWSS